MIWIFSFLNLKRVCIDPGFGLEDQASKQSADNLLISREMAKILSKKGYSPYLTRTSSVDTYIRTRYHFANYIGCDLLITMKRNTFNDSLIKTIGIQSHVRPLYNKNDLILQNETLSYALSLGKSQQHNARLEMEEGVQMYSASPSTVLFLLFKTNRLEDNLFYEYHPQYAKLIVDGIINSIENFT